MADGKVEYEIRGNDDKLGADIDKSTNTIKSHTSGWGDIAATAAKSIGAAFAGAVAAGAAALVGLAKAGVEYNATMEQYNTSFTTMLGGDKKAATDLTDQLQTLAAKTPLAMESIAKSAQTLLSFGAADASNVADTIRMIGDVAQGDAEKLQSLTLAFAQVSSTGKLMGQDLLQMINAGFNPLQSIAARTGETIGQLKERMSATSGGTDWAAKLEKALRSAEKAALDVETAQVKYNAAVEKYGAASSQAAVASIAVEKAQLSLTNANEDAAAASDNLAGGLKQVGISADEVKQAFIDSTSEGGKFYGAMEAQSETLNGKVSTLKDNFSQFAGRLTDNLTPAIMAVVDTMDGLISTDGDLEKSLGGVFDSVGKIIADALPVFVDLIQTLLPPLAQIAADVLPVIFEVIEALMPSIKSLAQSILPAMSGIFSQILPQLGNLVATLLPPILALIEAIVPHIAKLAEKLMPTLNTLVGFLAPLLDDLAEMLVPLIDLFFELLDPIIDIIDTALGPLLELLKPLVGVVLAGLIINMKYLIDILKAVADAVADYVAVAFDSLKKLMQGFIDFFTGIFTGDMDLAFKGIQEIIGSIIENVVGAAELLVNTVIGVINAVLGAYNKVAELTNLPTIELLGTVAWTETTKARNAADEAAAKKQADAEAYAAYSAKMTSGGTSTKSNLGQSSDNAQYEVGTSTTGRHASGIGYVMRDWTPAFLDRGERVLTADENKAYTLMGGLHGAESLLTGALSGFAGTQAAPIQASFTLSGDVQMDGFKVGTVVLRNFDDVAAFTMRG